MKEEGKSLVINSVSKILKLQLTLLGRVRFTHNKRELKRLMD